MPVRRKISLESVEENDNRLRQGSQPLNIQIADVDDSIQMHNVTTITESHDEYNSSKKQSALRSKKLDDRQFPRKPKMKPPLPLMHSAKIRRILLRRKRSSPNK